MIFPFTTTDDVFEFMDDLRTRGQKLQDERAKSDWYSAPPIEEEPETFYHIQAFTDNKLQWEEYRLDEEERDNLIKQAIESGFTYIVKTEVE